MKNLLIVYSLVLLSMILSACGRQDANTAAQTGRPTVFVVSDADLCNRIATWEQGVSDQLVSQSRGLAFYDAGVYELDFNAGTSNLITDKTYYLPTCKIIITGGVVTTSPADTIVWTGWSW